MDILTFEQTILNNPAPTVVEFWAPWCAPCRRIEPDLLRLEAEYRGRVNLVRINADEQPGLAQELNVYGIPTLLVYQGGQQTARRAGAQSPASLETLFAAAATGQAPAAPRLAFNERLLRLGVAGVFLALGLASGPSPLMLLAGAGVAFLAVYDRCPVWRALAPRLKRLVGVK
jgi:thioredoxin 1